MNELFSFDGVLLIIAVVYPAAIRWLIPSSVRAAHRHEPSLWEAFFGVRRHKGQAEQQANRELAIDREVPPSSDAVRAVVRRAWALRAASAATYAIGALVATATLPLVDSWANPAEISPRAFFANAWPAAFIALWVAIPSRTWRAGAAIAVAIVWIAAMPKELEYTAPLLVLLLFVSRSFTTLVPLSLVWALVGKATWLALMPLFPATEELAPLIAGAAAIGTGGIAVIVLGRLYEKRWFSDVSFSVAFLWILFAVVTLGTRSERVFGAVFAALVVYAVLASLLFSFVRKAMAERRPARLLVLRVFGASGGVNRLFSEIGSRWRYIGPVQTLAGTDSAIANLDVGEAARFMTGRKKSVFIRTDEDVQKRVGQPSLAPDRNGRYRIDDFFCTRDTWPDVFRELLDDADAVLVDLSGFRSSREGILLELRELFARKDLSTCVFLTDGTTDQTALDRTVREIWSHTGESSPNHWTERPKLLLLRDHSARKVTEALVAAAIAGGWVPETSRLRPSSTAATTAPV